MASVARCCEYALFMEVGQFHGVVGDVVHLELFRECLKDLSWSSRAITVPMCLGWATELCAIPVQLFSLRPRLGSPSVMK